MSIPRSLECLLVTATLAAGAVAQTTDDAALQRKRLAREQAQVMADARAKQAACAKEFAVSACTQQVLAERRASLATLERQRAELDEALRKRRAADRLARIEQRQAAAGLPTATSEMQAKTRAPQAARAQPADAAALSKREPRAPRAASAAASEDARAAQRARAAAEREKKAIEHRAAVEERNRERALHKAPAAPLPLPPVTTPSTSASMPR
jgi:colicin import membrane protein